MEPSNTVRLWLKDTVKLPQYANNFIDNGYDDIQVISKMLQDIKLKDIGIKDINDINHIIYHLNQLRISNNSQDTRFQEQRHRTLEENDTAK